MNQRHIVFDVETPNSANDRISAIGITIVEDGQIVKTLYTLVNPETKFDAFNVQLTGITPEMVRGKPTFPALWREIEPVMDSGLLVAHNAPFDMGVLAKCLRAYGIEWHPYTYYACTCAMGRACFKRLENHKLNTLCAYLGIPLDHHNAGSDSRATAELLLHYLCRGLCTDDYLRRYDLFAMRTDRPYGKGKPSATTR